MTMSKEKRAFIVNNYPNPDSKSVSTAIRISECSIERFDAPLADCDQGSLERAGALGQAIVEAVLQIPGVTGCAIEPYKLSICRGSGLFDWNDIMPSVLAELVKAHNRTWECNLKIDDFEVTKAWPYANQTSDENLIEQYEKLVSRMKAKGIPIPKEEKSRKAGW